MSDFNKIFRGKNRVEILIPFVSGVDSYNLQTSTNPISGPFTNRASILNVPEGASNPEFRNNVFFRFDPDEYVSGFDEHTFYVRLEPVVNGVPGTPGPLNVVAPDHDSNIPPEVIRDDATTTSTKIPFSRTAISISVINIDPSQSLFVAFEDGGTEITLPIEGDEFNDRGNYDCIYVRSDASTCSFQVVAILSAGDRNA